MIDSTLQILKYIEFFGLIEFMITCVCVCVLYNRDEGVLYIAC